MAGLILAIISAIAFGSGQVAIKIGLQGIKKVSSANLITLVSSLLVILLLTVILDVHSLRYISVLGLISFSVVGILNFPLARQFSYLGTKYIGVARSYPLTSVHSLVAIIVAAIFLKESATPAMFLGVLLIIGGISLFAREIGKEADSQLMEKRWSGFIFSLAAALFYGVAIVITRWASYLTTPLTGASISLFMGSLVQLLISRRDFQNIKRIRTPFLLSLVFGGMLSAIGVITLYVALSRANVAVVASIASTSPLFAVLLAGLVLRHREKITLPVILGAFLVVLGCIMVTLLHTS